MGHLAIDDFSCERRRDVVLTDDFIESLRPIFPV
jgi:hypothetical protein